MQERLRFQLPHLFVGKWTIQTRVGESAPGRLLSVSIEPAEGSLTDCQLTEFRAGQEPTLKHMEFHPDDDTLRSRDPAASLHISFWRHPSYDTIFALTEGADGKPVEVWNARRVPDPPTTTIRTAPRTAHARPWRISLREGRHAAEGYVILEQLSAGFNTTAGNGGKALGIYGLFHLDDLEDSEPELYDLLHFDETVGSYNSVFGVRSVNFRLGENAAADRLFATFDNRSTIPSTRMGGQTTLGRLLPSERGLVARAHDRLTECLAGRVPGQFTTTLGEDPEEEDPDVGVWVGEPP